MRRKGGAGRDRREGDGKLNEEAMVRSTIRWLSTNAGRFVLLAATRGTSRKGLTRYEAQFGRGGLKGQADSRNAIEDTQVRAVPDFARWTPPAEGHGLVEDTGQVGPSEEGVGMGQGTLAEAGFLGDGRSVEQDDVVTQVLMQEGCQSNVQNEIGGGERGIVGGSTGDAAGGGEETCPAVGWFGGSGDVAFAERKTTMVEQESRAELVSARQGYGGEGSGGRGPRRTTAGAGVIKRGITERYWKRDRKQWRKVLARLELMRRNGETQEDMDDMAVKEMLDRVPLLYPTRVDVPRSHLPRTP